MSEAEADELDRRGQVERDSYAAAAFGREQSSWAGYYFDQHAGGVPVFQFAGDTSELRSELEERLPAGMDFRLMRVARSYADLLESKEAVLASVEEIRSSGILITMVGLDIKGNQVVVGIDGLRASAESQLLDRFGSSLRFEDQAPAQADGCPWTDCRPLKGGIQIEGKPTDEGCTAGFVVRRALDNSLAILTAGHCIYYQDPADPYLKNWYHKTGAVEDEFGESLYHTFYDPPGTPLTKGDVGLVDIWSPEYPAAANRIWVGELRTVTGWVIDSNQTAESQVCAYGYSSNDPGCTTIRLVDVAKISELKFPNGTTVSHWIDHSNVYRYNLIGGDSGGPIYKPAFPNSSSVHMMGTHVHSVSNNPPDEAIMNQDGWYTPYGWGRLAYIDRAPSGDNYSVCVLAGC